MAAETAWAKINLTLHVTGRRADGFHDLDSLVAFADFGDEVTLRDAPGLMLGGAFAPGLDPGPANLAARAAALFPAYAGGLHLTKNLPIAAGLGGGSADAAAVLRLLSRHLGQPVPEGAAALGADVPACLVSRALRLGGRGERLSPVTLPQAFVLLVNPGVPLSTAAVFAARTPGFAAPMPDALPRFGDFAALCAFLRSARNDLTEAAVALAPEVALVLDRLRHLPGAGAFGLSGSGATSWALFADAAGAGEAALRLTRAQPSWWVRHAALRPD